MGVSHMIYCCYGNCDFSLFILLGICMTPLLCGSRKYPHSLHHRRCFGLHPSEKPNLAPYFSFKTFPFGTPLSLGISIDLPWGRYGYF